MLPAGSEDPENRALSPFVLLHGGRHGGWCWKRTAARLRSAGHAVYTPTLTGLGERSHLLSPAIGLDTHIQDLVGVFGYEDVDDAVLVAHSYGGMVACGAMERVADRVRALVLVDGYLPRAGESMMDLVDPATAEYTMDLAARDGEGWFLPPTDAAVWGVTDPADNAWVNGKTTAHPLKTYRDPVGPTDRAWAHPGVFIECLVPAAIRVPTARPRERAAVDRRFRYWTLEAPHDAMITAPHALAEKLRAASRLDPR
nr:alpha/beta fold hydrolase [Amycolatopsis rubida]